MRIRDNSSGRNAVRNLGEGQSKLAASLEKLSSGYRINRSADDAAGLAISEKMRMLVSGLDRAEKNSQEGIQLIQTGEGALEEIHAMLNRAIALAEASANGTYQDKIDREALQKEMDQICEEIDRIAGGAAFNTVKLFQDWGYAYETSQPYEPPASLTVGQQLLQMALRQSVEVAGQAKQAAGIQDSGMTAPLADIPVNPNGVNILYIERTDTVETAQSPAGSTTGASNLTIGGKELSKILQEEIIPNTVNNILTNYPAFSYLRGSNIGIGLTFNPPSGSGSWGSTLAYVAAGTNGSYMNYTLGVNLDVLQTVTTREGLADLEATIAHEMIHAFMDEATTSGMLGTDSFPSWFVEGMAQTASGPDNWVQYGLGVTASSTDAEIVAAIQKNPLTMGSAGSTASQYGTGYLACMYLGAAIAGGGTPSGSVTAQAVSLGLTKLFNEVVGGTSLDEAINAQTKGKFTSTADFASQFNAGSPEIGQFVRDLLTATGSGRGGIVSGDLTATDLTPDTDLGDSVKLFLLNPTNSTVKNIYPTNYPIFSGGTTSGTTNVAPPDFQPVDPSPKEYGDLVVSGAVDSDIEYDATNKVLTIKAAGDIKISMKNNNIPAAESIILQGSGKVTLDGVKLAAGRGVQIKQDVEISYEGENLLSVVNLDADTNASFHGNGTLQVETVASDNTNSLTFTGGSVVVNGGTGNITAKSVTIDHAVVMAGTVTPPPTSPAGVELQEMAFPWDGTGGSIASLTIDGKKTDVLLSGVQKDATKGLWLDPSGNHRVTFTAPDGASKTMAAVEDVDNPGTLKWAEPVRPFTVTGGTEGIDWAYEDDGRTLVVKTAVPLTISGGTAVDENGDPLLGKIKLEDGIAGTVDLTLDEVACDATADKACALELGKDNTVTLTLVDGKTSSFTSGGSYAGIHIGTGTALTINGTDTSVLEATGNGSGAGIGSNGLDGIDAPGSSITINGGHIVAEGVKDPGTDVGGAGIGAGTHSAFGDITINGGIIEATGGTGGAGIGGAGDDRRAPFGHVGDITITGGDITAHSNGHGAGIGGGWGLGVGDPTAHSGNILISGGTIRADSETHGTGIGAGCLAVGGDVTITGTAHIVQALGGSSGAGIGSSSSGKCGDIVISGGAVIDLAKGGNNGAGIGSGSYSTAGSITIDTTGSIWAEGGTNGVGIGSGYNNSSCTDIVIKQGTISAQGSTDSTGIGAGRNSISGNITIGDEANPNNKVVVDATGGMTNNGGNIISYTDKDHTKAGTLTVLGDNTTVRPGQAGEGLYSTSGAVDKAGVDADGNPLGSPLYSYPIYLFPVDPVEDPDDPTQTIPGTPPLPAASEGIPYLPLPDGAAKIQITAVGADGTTKTWTQGLSHQPLDENYDFIWMTGQDQKLTITYEDGNGTLVTVPEIALKFYPDAGVFRAPNAPVPPPAEVPDYNTKPPVIVDEDRPAGAAGGGGAGRKVDQEKRVKGGIILQIGANYGETLEIPRFYLSAKALGMENLDISTQKSAGEAMSVIKSAVNRVSSIRGTYGALYNRLEHNQSALNQSVENTTDAESRIRDVDVAREYMKYTAQTIRTQAAQAMAAQCNQNASRILQLLQ